MTPLPADPNWRRRSPRATLLVVSTQPIGTGQRFEPRIASVSVEILPQAIPDVIALPQGGGSEVVLYVGHQQNGYIPIYLCNPTPLALEDVVVDYGGLYTAAPSKQALQQRTGSRLWARCRDVLRRIGLIRGRRPFRVNPVVPLIGSSRTFPRIEPSIARLIERRNVMNEGESIDQARVRFCQGGTSREAHAILPRNLFRPRFIALQLAPDAE